MFWSIGFTGVSIYDSGSSNCNVANSIGNLDINIGRRFIVKINI